MSRDSSILRQIGRVIGDGLEGTEFPLPDVAALVQSVNLVRLERLPRFWDVERPGTGFGGLRRAVADLVCAFHGQGAAMLYLLCCDGTETSVWLGCDARILDTQSLARLLAGTLPGARVGSGGSFDTGILTRLPHAVALTGVPSVSREENKRPDREGLEKLCRGLAGHRWVYATWARPCPRSKVHEGILETTSSIRDAHASYMLKGSVVDEQDRLARRYVDLLEAKLQRLERARCIGLWQSTSFLAAEEPSVRDRATGLLLGAFASEEPSSAPLRVHLCRSSLAAPPEVEPLVSDEVAVLASPPRESFPGFFVGEYVRFGVETPPPPRGGEPHIALGALMDHGVDTGQDLRIPRHSVTKHGLVVGVTGSGKTNTCLSLLDQIWDGGNGVPFLVIEPAKSEYRDLLRSERFEGLNVFTVGDETVSPLRLNPFFVPRGVFVQTHIDFLKSLFAAAFVLYPPMPYVLEQSLQQVYEDRGWNTASNTNRRGESTLRSFPTLADLAEKISTVIERMGYDERITMDVRAGLLARVNQLRIGGGKGLMFGTRESVDASVLFERPCVLEMKRLVSDDEKAFLIGLLLIRLYEHHEVAQAERPSGLVHVTLIEEAHRLLRDVRTENGGDSANPKGNAIEVFANILSEIRAYGEGIFIAEQIPTKLTPDALKNTNLKIVHRLVSDDDRHTVGAAMNLDDRQMRALATLDTGCAVAYAEGLPEAVLLRIPNVNSRIAGRADDQTIRDAMRQFWEAHAQLRRPFQGCKYCPSEPLSNGCAQQICASVGAPDQLDEAATRLLNAMRLLKAKVMPAFSAVQGIVDRSPGSIRGDRWACCKVIPHAEAELDRRGEFYGWAHVDVEQALDLASRVVTDLSRGFRRVASKELERTVSKSLRAYANLMRRLHTVDPLPFPGCRSCSDPCQFRYDAERASSPAIKRDFSTAFYEGTASEVARICWNATWDQFLADDARSRAGAALCVGVQQFGEMGLSDVHQVEQTARLAEALAGMNRKTGKEGQSAS